MKGRNGSLKQLGLLVGQALRHAAVGKDCLGRRQRALHGRPALGRVIGSVQALGRRDCLLEPRRVDHRGSSRRLEGRNGSLKQLGLLVHHSLRGARVGQNRLGGRQCSLHCRPRLRRVIGRHKPLGRTDGLLKSHRVNHNRSSRRLEGRNGSLKQLSLLVHNGLGGRLIGKHCLGRCQGALHGRPRLRRIVGLGQTLRAVDCALKRLALDNGRELGCGTAVFLGNRVGRDRRGGRVIKHAIVVEVQLLALEGESAATQHAVRAAVDDTAVGQVGETGRHDTRVGVKVARTVGEMHKARDTQAVLVVVLHHTARQGHEAGLHGTQLGLEVTPRAAHEALAAQEPAANVVMRVTVEERPAVGLVFLNACDAKAPLGVGRVAHEANLHTVAGDLHRRAREVGAGVTPHHRAVGAVDLDEVVAALKVRLLVKCDGKARSTRIAVHPGIACAVGISVRAGKVGGLRHHVLVADDLDLHRLRHATAIHRSAGHRG